MSWGLRILKYCLQYRHETICNIFKKGNFSSAAQSVKWAFCCCGCYQSKEAKLLSILLLRSYFSWKFEDASMFFFGSYLGGGGQWSTKWFKSRPISLGERWPTSDITQPRDELSCPRSGHQHSSVTTIRTVTEDCSLMGPTGEINRAQLGQGQDRFIKYANQK